MSLNGDNTVTPLSKEAGLVVMYGDELGKVYKPKTSSAVIGRASECDIRVDQESVSRNHASIVNTGKAILVRDLGSTNGTYVNDLPIEEHVLHDSDHIKVGRTIFKFLSAENIEIAYHEEVYRLVLLNQPVRAVPLATERSTTTTIARPENGHSDGGPRKRTAGFELHHIGEPLLAAILTELSRQGRLSGVRVKRLAGDVDCDTAEVKFDAEISFAEAFGTFLGDQPKFAAECSLRHRELSFDPLSQIDLLMIGSRTAMPWEIKLGKTGLGRGDFLTKFCQGTGANKQHTKLVAGSMISILQDWVGNTGRLMDGGGLDADDSSPSGLRIPLERRWGLIARRSVVKALAKSSPIRTKNKGKYGCLRAGVYVMTFEDLVEAVSVERFWEIVEVILDASRKRLEDELVDVRDPEHSSGRPEG